MKSHNDISVMDLCISILDMMAEHATYSKPADTKHQLNHRTYICAEYPCAET